MIQADILSPTLDEAKFITGEVEINKILQKLHAAGALVCTKLGTIGLAIPTYDDTINWMESNKCSVKKI